MSNEAMKLALEALKNTYALRDDVIEAIKALEEALVADKSAPKQEQQVVSLQCVNCQVTIDTLNDKVMSLLAKQEHDCTRSHPHEEMSKECELRTEIARLTNQLANTKQEQGSTTCDKPVAHCEAGPDYCLKCLEEAKPTYGSEEIRKLREVIASQAKIIEDMALAKQEQGSTTCDKPVAWELGAELERFT
jgi:hypothetical protein